jgi:fatty acid CoA ligase FadD9
MIFYPSTLSVGVSYQPLSHIVDRHHVAVMLFNGARIVLCPNIVDIFETIQIAKPTILFGVPRFYNKIYDEFKISKLSLEEFESNLGGRCKFIICGGAPLDPEVKSFLKSCFHATVIAGYGATETGNINFDNGKINVEYILLDVPELNYSTKDKPFPRGELCVKTQNMFKGYYNNNEKTKESFTEDGFYKTGDIVEIDDQKNCKVIARRKESYKMGNGEFLQPTRLEGIYTQHSLISQIFIHVDTARSYLIGVVVPHQQTLLNYAKSEGIQFKNYNELISKEEIRQVLLQSLNENKNVEPFERLSDIIIVAEDFTVENKILNVSMKINRSVADEFFKERISQIKKKLDSNNFQRVEALLKNVFKSKNGTFKEMGGDSLSAVQISHAIKQNFNLHISADEIKNLNQEEIEKFVKEKKESKIQEIDPFKDSILDPRILGDLSTMKYENKMKNVLVTGSTGFIGPFILEKLLMETDCDLFCLIRANDERSGYKKIERKLQESLIFSRLNKSHLKRIHILIGDVSMSKLGLNDKKYDEISSIIDTVIHGASQVNLVYDYTDLRNVNVFGTLNVLQFSTNKMIKKIVYLSTTDVYGSEKKKFNDIVFSEDFDIPKDNLNVRMGYAISKWVSEKLLVQSHEIGVPVIILRLSNISGDEETGYSNSNDFISRFLTGLLNLNSFPILKDDDYFTSFISVNYFCDSLLMILTNEESNGKAFNVVNPNGKPLFKELYSCLSEFKVLRTVQYSEWLLNIPKHNPLYEISMTFDKEELPKFGSKQMSSSQYQKFCKNKIPKEYSKIIAKLFSYFSTIKHK